MVLYWCMMRFISTLPTFSDVCDLSVLTPWFLPPRRVRVRVGVGTRIHSGGPPQDMGELDMVGYMEVGLYCMELSFATQLTPRPPARTYRMRWGRWRAI